MKNMLYILIIFLSFSCNKQEEEIFTMGDIKEFTKMKHGLFYNMDIMFVKTANNKFSTVDVNYLHIIYNKEFTNKYSKFERFLFDALNQKIIFDYTYFKGTSFEIDENIKKEYTESGISPMLDKYCERVKNKFTFKQQDLVTSQLYTVMYYFFINGYKVSFNDISGFYSVKLKNI